MTTVAGGTSPDLLYNNAGTLGNETTLAASQEPAHTGDMTNSAGSLATAVGHVNGVSYPASPSTNTVPVVTAANITTYEQLPASALAAGASVANLGFTPLNPANNGSDFASVPTALATIEGGAPTVVTATGSAGGDRRRNQYRLEPGDAGGNHLYPARITDRRRGARL